MRKSNLIGVLYAVFVLLGVVVLACPTMTYASVIYSYQGNNYSEFTGETYDATMSLTMTLTFAEALPPGFYNYSNPLPAYEFTAFDGVFNYVQYGPVDEINVFEVWLDIDSAGNITEHYVKFDGFQSRNWQHFISPGDLMFPNDSAYANVPGVWTMVPATPVPEPASLLLLGSGLVGMLGLKRRLKK